MSFYPNPHPQGCPWHSFAESMGSPNIKWCEETICSWISEPANAWSNAAYLISTLIIFYLAYKNKHHSILKKFPIVIFIMGGFSFIYHLSNFYGTQVLDFVGMFFLLGWTTGFNLIRMEKMKRSHLWIYMAVVIAVNTALVHVLYLMNIKFQFIMLVGAILIVFSEYLARERTKVNYGWFVGSLFLLTVALAFSLADHTKLWCDPSQHGLFSQGHALWHWISGLAMIGIYKHYSQSALEPHKER
jgi:Ceramidase